MSAQVKKFLPATVAAALGIAVSLASPAAQGQDKGFYIGGQAGVSLPEDTDLDLTGGASLDAGLNTGWAAGLGFGYAYGNGIRGEMELGYHANDVDDVSGASATGDIGATSLMINGYYDFYTGGKWQPYVGAGFGAAHVSADTISPVSGSSVDDSDTGFAFQGMLGVAYAVSDRVRLTLGYRYFSVPDLGFTTAGGTDVDSDYSSHDIMLGARFLFGAAKQAMPEPVKPAAAPMAAPAPAPAPMATPKPAPAPAPAPGTRNFLVFFDWDRSTLTPQAQSIIRSAAAEAKRVGSARIRATGHSDRSGAVRYNQGLSMRRAVAVRGMLESLGIPRNQIAILAKGEAEPLVPTADGVREPQNRRVEIVLE